MTDGAVYLARMGIDVWVERSRPSFDLDAAVPAEEAGSEPADADWDKLKSLVKACTRCALHQSRTQTVFGTGSESADWLIVGEAPGAEEDRQGEPFVGRAGQLLNSMLRAIGLRREQVYIANMLKCRPPNNRDPQLEEVAACGPYLQRQIALLKPRVVLAVGRIAAQNLLGESRPIGKMRGQRYEVEVAGLEQAVPVFVTYHPAYLLRSPHEKRKVWQDLVMALDTCREFE